MKEREKKERVKESERKWRQRNIYGEKKINSERKKERTEEKRKR